MHFKIAQKSSLKLIFSIQKFEKSPKIETIYHQLRIMAPKLKSPKTDITNFDDHQYRCLTVYLTSNDCTLDMFAIANYQ